jgi:hypothetical protein
MVCGSQRAEMRHGYYSGCQGSDNAVQNGHGKEAYRVLRKYLNQNPGIFEPFDTGKFIDLYKKQ